jgi:hypothetical protein
MGDGIADDLDQRRLDHAQDVGIEPYLAALALEHDLLRQAMRGVARHSFKYRKKRSDRNQTQPFSRIAKLMEFAVHLIDAGAKSDAESAEGPAQFLGDGKGPIHRLAPIPVRRQLRQQQIGQMPGLLQPVGHPAQPGKQRMGFRHAVKHRIQLRKIGPHTARAFFGSGPCRRRRQVPARWRPPPQKAADLIQMGQ